jgi:general secretion pathway protein E
VSVLGIGENAQVFKGKGCKACGFTGYHGRSGIFELLAVNDDIRRLIMSHADASEIRGVARGNGMRTLLEDGALKVAAGITTVSEVLRVTQE